MKKTKYLPGEKYGKLTIIEEAKPSSKTKERRVKCKCECGNEKIMKTRNLGSGHSKSCGEGICLYRKYHPRISSARTVYRQNYKDGNLTFEEFLELSQQNCYYCNASPNNKTNVHKGSQFKSGNASQFSVDNGDFKYNGLDRVNNNLPHNKDNCVPCCFKCNSMKSKLGKAKFLQQIQQIAIHSLGMKKGKGKIKK